MGKNGKRDTSKESVRAENRVDRRQRIVQITAGSLLVVMLIGIIVPLVNI